MEDNELLKKKEEENETPVVVDDERTDAEGDTLTPSEENVESLSHENADGEESVKPPEKMLTQSQVNELVGRARQEGRESALRDLLARYGVNDDKELDSIFGKGQTYDDLNDDFSLQNKSLKEVSAENALLKSRIDEERWDDVKLILGGKGLEINSENIEALIPSHPEWRPTAEAMTKTLSPEDMETLVKNAATEVKTEEPPTILRKLGNGMTEKAEESEEVTFKKLFGF